VVLRPGDINPLNAKLYPICHMLALLGAHHIFHVSGVRIKGAEQLHSNFRIFSCAWGTLCSAVR